jgi:hypothetical protein
MHCRANQLVLALQTVGQDLLIETGSNQIVVRRALAPQNCAANVNQRQNDRRLQTFVLGLDVIDNAVVLNVCVVSSDHFPSRSLSSGQHAEKEGQLESSTRIFRRSMNSLFTPSIKTFIALTPSNRWPTILACTIILKQGISGREWFSSTRDDYVVRP